MINLLRTKEIKKEITNNPANVLDIIEAEKQLGICITNKDGVFVAVNSRYTQIYGHSKDALTGQHFSMVLPPEHAEELSKRHDDFMENKYEIIRNWEVMNQNGKLMKIQADAGYFESIFDKTPHKVTFVNLED